jgi:hypothetical protein
MPIDLDSAEKPPFTRPSINRPQSADLPLSAGYRELIEAEGDTTRILHFHPVVVPGLLQTREYATAITWATILHPVTPAEIEIQVEARMRRQRDVLHSARSVSTVFIVEEESIRRLVGSRQIMRAQLEHLIRMIDHPAVSIFLLPAEFPPHPGITGPFMLIQNSDPRQDDVLCLEGAMGNTVIRDRPDLAADYSRLAERLMTKGRSGADARRAIGSLHARLGPA